jgi:hypothetical protein
VKIYKKVNPPKEGVTKDYIQRDEAVIPSLNGVSCTPSISTVQIPANASISCPVNAT